MATMTPPTGEGTAPLPASPRTVGGRPRLAGLLALLAVLGLTAVSWLLGRPPQPLPSTAAADGFSAERAVEQLHIIAPDHPTPIGSPASDDVRDHLVAELRGLGLRVEVQEGVGAFGFGGNTSMGRVENVVATLPGTDPTGRVLLSAHYDTTFGSPGAADDKAAVAALLETARAFTAGERPRNDVVVVLTDGEEPGMLGASAFAATTPGTATDVVLNWEATGNAGPSALFETTPGSAALVDAWARWAPRPVGDSAMAALYADSGQNTDLTVLREAGYRGLNFALMEGTAYYHHSRDTVANLDPGSLQHQGATMLALARGLGDADLTTATDDDGARVFFTAFGRAVAYSDQLALPLAGLATALVLLLAVDRRRAGATTIPRILAGLAAAVVTVVVSAAAAAGLWELLAAVRPGYRTLFMGEPFRSVPYRWALGLLVAAVALAGYLLLRRRVGAEALRLGALLWLAVLGLGAALTLPGASFYGTVAAGAAALAGLIAPRVPKGGWRSAVLAAGTVPGAALLLAGGLAVLGVMGISLGYYAAVLLATAAVLVLPLLDLGSTTRPALPVRWVLLPAGAAVVLAVVGLAVDRFDPAHPQAAHLAFVQDEDGATWVSTDAVPHPWVAGHASGPAAPSGVPPLPYGSTPRWTGPAPSLALPAPEVSVNDVTTLADGQTTVSLHVTSRRDADVLVVHVDRPLTEVGAAVGGLAPVRTVTEPGDGQGPWAHELRFYDPPADGVHLVLDLPGDSAPTVHVSDYTVGLDVVPDFVPRSGDVDRSADHSSDLVVVGARHPL